MMKKLFLSCFLAVSLITNLSAQKKESAQIPTLAWVGVPESETTIERFLELKEAGFTHNFSFYTSADAFEKALKIAEKVGVKMILNCPELKKDPENTVRRFMKSKALDAYYLTDEPGRSSFPELGDWARRIQAVDNKRFCYLNLFPNYAPTSALGTETYREHVNIFIKEVPLQVLSFDHYPVVGATSADVRDIWYENLEIFADEAAKVNKPFWAFALTVAHGPYPVPTIPALRMQIYSDLAYGAQGIQYFTYQTPPDPQWDFNNAPITKEMKRNQVYDMVKSMNQEIKALSPVFLGAKVISLAHTGKNIPIGTKQLSALPTPIKSVETEGLGAVVSHLKNGKEEYLVIVNRDMVKTMKLTVKSDPSVQKVLKDGTTLPASTYMDTIMVEPGDVQIFKWKQ
ncbi:apurinic/apyrimidinic endonuclease family protein [Pedobacter psychroterrae]|uniref:hypothetical protein n=1 Tax=Pedobacter psychroterrae TaxID=2530453 RepID=UPI00197D91D7|nr:hypothetical protein [Pedobacter psychroterrae]